MPTVFMKKRQHLIERDAVQAQAFEQGLGGAKFFGPIRQVMVRGIKKDDQLFVLTMAAYNLTRCAPWHSSGRWPRDGSKELRKRIRGDGNGAADCLPHQFRFTSELEAARSAGTSAAY